MKLLPYIETVPHAFANASGHPIGAVIAKVLPPLDARNAIAIEMTIDNLSYIREAVATGNEDAAPQKQYHGTVRWRDDREAWLAMRLSGRIRKGRSKAFKPEVAGDETRTAEAHSRAWAWVNRDDDANDVADESGEAEVADQVEVAAGEDGVDDDVEVAAGDDGVDAA